jgi:hypothetical protein
VLLIHQPSMCATRLQFPHAQHTCTYHGTGIDVTEEDTLPGLRP